MGVIPLYRFCEICEKCRRCTVMIVEYWHCRLTLYRLCIMWAVGTRVYYGLCGVSVFRLHTMEQRTESRLKISGLDHPVFHNFKEVILLTHIERPCVSLLSCDLCLVRRSRCLEDLERGRFDVDDVRFQLGLLQDSESLLIVHKIIQKNS